MQAWKYAISEDGEKALIELDIPDDAERIMFFNIGRASNAIVENIYICSEFTNSFTKEIKKAYSAYDHRFVYEFGKTVTPDSFDNDANAVCTHGIHFFKHQDIALYEMANDLWYTNSLYYFNKELAMRKEIN